MRRKRRVKVVATLGPASSATEMIERLFLAGVDGLYQTLAIGILVIVAVAVDQWIRKVRK